MNYNKVLIIIISLMILFPIINGIIKISFLENSIFTTIETKYPSWKEAYKNTLKDDNILSQLYYDDNKNLVFTLAYINNDDIPELIISSNNNSIYTRIYILYYNPNTEKVEILKKDNEKNYYDNKNNFYYIEKSGIIIEYTTNINFENVTIYKMKNNSSKLKKIYKTSIKNKTSHYEYTTNSNENLIAKDDFIYNLIQNNIITNNIDISSYLTFKNKITQIDYMYNINDININNITTIIYKINTRKILLNFFTKILNIINLIKI